MANIDFPNSPTIGDTFTVGQVTWQWDGATWKSFGLEENQYLIGVTSSIQDQLDGKEPSLPSQSGNAGKFLSTDGTSASWEAVNVSAIDDNYVMSLMGAI